MSICWAYDKQMRRCTLDAGHAGDHHIIITWTDDECFTPSSPSLMVVQDPNDPLKVTPLAAEHYEIDPAPPPPPKPQACVACNHHHKGGTCKCGCYEHI